MNDLLLLYQDEDGRRHQAPFDLVVLSVGMEIAPATLFAQHTDTNRDILVTFENSGARATTSTAPYRARKRYSISAEARQQANAVAAEYRLQQIDHWPIKSLSVYCFVYRVAAGDDRESTLAKLRKDARVESAQALNVFETGTKPAPGYDDTYGRTVTHAAQVFVLPSSTAMQTRNTKTSRDEFGA